MIISKHEPLLRFLEKNIYIQAFFLCRMIIPISKHARHFMLPNPIIADDEDIFLLHLQRILHDLVETGAMFFYHLHHRLIKTKHQRDQNSTVLKDCVGGEDTKVVILASRWMKIRVRCFRQAKTIRLLKTKSNLLKTQKTKLI